MSRASDVFGVDTLTFSALTGVAIIVAANTGRTKPLVYLNIVVRVFIFVLIVMLLVWVIIRLAEAAQTITFVL